VSRWVHAQATVKVGDNEQKVRGLTHRERAQFAEASKKIREQKMQATELPALVAGFGCVGLADGDLDDMPAELMDACVEKILDLTGINKDKDDDKPAAPGDGEKKGPSSLPNS
jgi:hypothetical protein